LNPAPTKVYWVARDRFKYRFKISGLRQDFLPFLENIPKISSKYDFNTIEAFRTLEFNILLMHRRILVRRLTSVSAGAVNAKEKGGACLLLHCFELEATY